MSTEIALHPTLAHIHEDRVRLYTFEGERVDIEAEETRTGRCVTAVTTRTALLDAIRGELNVIVIDKAELPEVEPYTSERDLVGVGTFSKSSSPEALRREALRYLAYAAYLEANPPKPPIDVEKVNAFSQLIREVDGNHDKGAGALAEALLATGRIDIKDPS